MPLGRVCRQPERSTRRRYYQWRNLKGPLNGAGGTPPPVDTPASIRRQPRWRPCRNDFAESLCLSASRLGDWGTATAPQAASRWRRLVYFRIFRSESWRVSRPVAGRRRWTAQAGQRSRLRLKSTSAHTTETPTSAQDRRAASRAAKRRVRLPRVLQSDGGQREGARSSHCHAMLQRRMGYDRFPGVEGDGSSTHARTHARTGTGTRPARTDARTCPHTRTGARAHRR
jgi:hypothetical protein